MKLTVSLLGIVALLETSSQTAGAAEGAPAAASYQTTVTSTTPLHGSGLPRERVPGNVQTATAADLDASRSLDLTEYLEGAAGSVHLNQVVGNPLQPDVQYRGFAASPVLGAPQGMTVYLDGVRLNEPFGDTINWDLLPTGAIRTTNLMAGSNPVFGLNTLGGSLSIQTKDGFTHPGARAQLSGGSFARRGMTLELGTREGPFAAFVATNVVAEDGWRAFSPSEAKQAFVVLSYLGDATRVDVSLAGADTRLEGNGPAPVQLLAIDRRAVFTHPDRTTNQLLLGTLRAERRLREGLRLSGLAYLRGGRVRTFNGDQAAWERCAPPASPDQLCAEDEDGDRPVEDLGGNPVPFDAARPFDAALNHTRNRQLGFGAALQLAWRTLIRGRENDLFAGVTADEGRSRFFSYSELGRLSLTREALPAGIVDRQSLVRVDTVTRSLGLFATDTLALRPDLFLMVAARYNLSALSLEDRVDDDLDGDHDFGRLNPAVGISYQPRPFIGGFASYSESARAPTALELSCADPDAPCRLPNSFVSDPPLEQVVARTVELGARGRLTRGRLGVSYSAAAFHAHTTSDIVFISAGPLTSQGYFANIGRTRRQGIELAVEGRRTWGEGGPALLWSAHYTFLDATFRSPFVASSPNHPGADAGGTLPVQRGHRVPGVPRHLAKAGVTLDLGRVTVGAGVIVNGGQYLRGDEANRLAPLPGYALLDLRAAWQLTPALTVFARARNVLDADFATFGALGDPSLLGAGFDDQRFHGPGAPRGLWGGVDLRY